MAFRIQRVPRGLNELLSIFGGQTPVEMENSVRATLELLQMYGLSQLQSLGTNNAATAEGVAVSVQPSATQWTVLFTASTSIVKTATMTALTGTIAMRRTGNADSLLRSEQLGPFGATETGVVAVAHVCPYPMLLPPGTLIIGRANIIGTDATANVTTFAEFGVVGP